MNKQENQIKTHNTGNNVVVTRGIGEVVKGKGGPIYGDRRRLGVVKPSAIYR